jgi:peptidoglycan/xylan/chitin deacetylase (PgdA/CDA1 family)/GT2 family glycosyltransferase
LRETLASLGVQFGKNFEVVVVCDGEDQPTRALADHYVPSFPLTWMFRPNNLGAASARNWGASAAKGNLLLFLDDDTITAPEWLLHHQRHHANSHTGDVMVCGRIVECYPQPPPSHTEGFLRERRNRILTGVATALAGPDMDCGYHVYCGLNCSIRRATFWSCGGFDPVLRHVNEDIELGLRIHNQGIQTIFEPRAVVYHRGTTRLQEHYVRGVGFAGSADAYRVARKRQRHLQTQALAGLYSGRIGNRLKQHIAWRLAREVRSVAELCRKATDATGSEFFFRRWANSIASAAYWEGVRSEGLTLPSLRRLVGSPFPVLMFHSISSSADRRLRKCTLSPQRFSQLMRWLSRANYRCLSPLECVGGPVRSGSVLLTFDDGYEDFFSTAFPILHRLGLTATVFLVVDRIGQSNLWDQVNGHASRRLLSIGQIRELHRYGVEFGSHSLTHPWLPELSDHDLQREVVDSKAFLEDLLGSEVSCFAYPSGGVNARVRATVARAGYKVAVGTRANLTFWEDRLCLNRIGVSELDKLFDFVLKLRTGRSYRHDFTAKVLEFLRGGLRCLPSSIACPLQQAVRKIRW